MSTGLPNIDAQHKEIIDKYNELAEALAQGGGIDRIVAGELLDFLQFYSAWHFEREEKCMEEYKCPAAEANKQAHAEFMVIFGQLYEEWWSTTMDPALVQETFTKVGEWIENHILRVDAQLLPCVREAG
jgi:hemerythrin